MSKQLLNREELGKQLQNQVQRIDDKNYCIKSLTSKKIYEIVSTQLGFVCSCPDHMFRGIKCKHIIATELSLKIREIVKRKIIEPIVNIGNCIFYKSAQIVKDGLRHIKYGDIQKFNCKDCKKYFT
ncbi:MAG: SWIM zinc finger family protein, partial [Nitrososphaeraceae archaeon]